MKFRDINGGAKYDKFGADGKVESVVLPYQDDEVHEAKIVGVATIENEITGQALAGYDVKGDCYAAHVFPAETVIVVCEVEL